MSLANGGESVTMCCILDSNYFTPIFKAPMKKFLQFSLAILAVSTLAACGGGNSSDLADTYAGNWKSDCYAYTGGDNNTYYKTTIANFAKSSAAELIVTHNTTKAHSDSSCKNVLGTISDPVAIKINIGESTTFLGANAHNIVYTIISTGEARTGFITADATKLSVVVTDATGARPAGWGAASPYTKL